jgi:hypothetical protein
VSLSPVENPQATESDYEAVSNCVNISVSSADASATVTPAYDGSAVGDESALVLGKYDEDTGSWAYVGTVDGGANTVTAEVASVSQFVVLNSQDSAETPTGTAAPVSETTVLGTPLAPAGLGPGPASIVGIVGPSSPSVAGPT